MLLQGNINAHFQTCNTNKYITEAHYFSILLSNMLIIHIKCNGKRAIGTIIVDISDHPVPHRNFRDR
jgi:hypothetical protein